MREESRKAIEHAKQYLDNDPSLAAFILRDLPEVKEKELESLAWLLADGKNYTTKNDVLGLIELLETDSTNPQELTCETIGERGDCGPDCPLFLLGHCDVENLSEPQQGDE